MFACALLILFVILGYSEGSVIDTSAILLYTASNITCSSNESCSIYCDEDIGEPGPCQSAIIHCPSDYQCNIWCTTDYACKESTIYCPLNGECNIYCFGKNACSEIDIIEANIHTEATLTCSSDNSVCADITFPIPPSDEPMNLECGVYGCEESTIYCPANAECNIICDGS